VTEQAKRAQGEAAQTAHASAAIRHAGQLVMFPRAKKRCGRPRKGAATPSSKLPDDVATAVVAIATDKALWAAAREIVRQKVMRDHARMSGAARDLVVMLLDKINRQWGYDWRSITTAANELQRDRKTLKRAYAQGMSAGYLLRKTAVITEARAGGPPLGRVSLTTIPALVVAATELRQGQSGQPAAWGQKNPQVGGRKTRRVGAKKPRRWGQKIPDGGGEITPQTLIGKPDLNPSARERAADEGSKSASPDAAPRYRPNWDGLRASIAGRSPRFDRARPMRERISLWQFGEPTDPADVKCRRQMLDLAKGQDLAVLRDQFCRWVEGPGRTAPRDAQEAFLAWLASTSERRGSRRTSPAAQENALGAGVERVWAAEDQQDAPQRAPFEPIGQRLLRRPVGRVSAELLAKIKRGT
jgi:hypothetical protein